VSRVLLADYNFARFATWTLEERENHAYPEVPSRTREASPSPFHGKEEIKIRGEREEISRARFDSFRRQFADNSNEMIARGGIESVYYRALGAPQTPGRSENEGRKFPGELTLMSQRKWFRQRLQTTCRQLITRRKLLTYARRRRRGRANAGTDVSAVGDPLAVPLAVLPGGLDLNPGERGSLTNLGVDLA
jgi:hypothetical protein